MSTSGQKRIESTIDTAIDCDEDEVMELAMQAGYSTAPDEVRSLGFGAGMGLPNMKKYTDSMEIDTRIGEGTKITMVVKI